MPTATHPTLDPDTIYDLLFLARTGEASELTDTLSHLAISLSTTPDTLLLSSIDPDSGNSTLHMASANGHTGTFPPFLSITIKTTNYPQKQSTASSNSQPLPPTLPHPPPLPQLSLRLYSTSPTLPTIPLSTGPP